MIHLGPYIIGISRNKIVERSPRYYRPALYCLTDLQNRLTGTRRSARRVRLESEHQSAVSQRVEASRIWSIIATTSLNVRSQALIDCVPVRARPRCIQTLEFYIMGINAFVSWANIEPRFFRNYTEVTLIGQVRLVGDIVADVVFS